MRQKWLIAICAAIAFAVMSGLVRSADDTVVLDTPRFISTKSLSRIVFDLPKPVDFSYFTLPNPPRFIVDLRHTKYQGRAPDPATLGPYVLTMRDGITEKKRLRIVFDLTERVESRAFIMPGNNDKPERLVIDLAPLGSDGLALLSQSTESIVPVSSNGGVDKGKQVVISTAQPKTNPVVPDTPKNTTTGASPGVKTEIVAPSRVVSIPKTTTKPVVIAIDPGHGGIDPGAIGQKGRYEKLLVLQIGKRLAKLIDAEPGMAAMLTREDDSFVSLRERTDRARDASAELFISLHADAWKTANASGTSIYALSRSGASSEAARWLADKENAADLVGGISLNDKDSLVAEVLLDLSINRAINDGTEFAKDLLREFRPIGKLHGENVERAGFVVLKSPDMASVLIELGFITNPNDERRLSDPKHQQKVAEAIFQGIKRYISRRPRTAQQPSINGEGTQG